MDEMRSDWIEACSSHGSW